MSNVFGIINLILYFMIAVPIVFILRLLIKMPSEVFRKILHFILLGSFLVIMTSFSTWYYAALTAITFEILVYPILLIFEKWKKYSEFTTERKSGELKHSLLLVYTMFAIVVTICWGLFEDKCLAIASLYAWGIGDAFAALVGKRFGKHKVIIPKTNNQKSFEGTVTMFACSAITVFVILIIRGGLNIASVILISTITAIVSALSELWSTNGNDTFICPISAMMTLLPLVYLFGGMQ